MEEEFSGFVAIQKKVLQGDLKKGTVHPLASFSSNSILAPTALGGAAQPLGHPAVEWQLGKGSPFGRLEVPN